MRPQVAYRLGVALTAQVAQAGQASFRLRDDVGSFRYVAFGLLRVMHHHETPSGDAAPVDDDFLALEAGRQGLVTPRPRQRFGQGAAFAEAHLLTDYEGVTGALQGAAVLGAVEAGVHHHDHPAQLPVVQVLLDFFHHRNVHRVAGPHPAAHWDAVPGNGEAEHRLRQVSPGVLAVTTPPQTGSCLGVGSLGTLPGDISVFAFDLEVGA